MASSDDETPPASESPSAPAPNAAAHVATDAPADGAPLDAGSLAANRLSRFDLPSVQVKQEARSHRLLMLVVRLLFLVLLGTVTILTIASERRTEDFGFSTIVGLFLATTSIGIIVLTLDAITPNKRLSSVVGVYLGVCFGLIGAIAVGSLIDVVADAWDLSGSRQALYLGLGKVIVGIVLCYLSVSVVLTTKDDFRLVIPYVEFAKQVRGVRPLLIDTSALIDGRINDLGQTGFLDAPLICPQFVVDELQALADSGDRAKRTRGRRGLDVLARMQSNPYLDLSVDNPRVEGVSVDRMLIELAKDQKLRIVTTDANLKKVALINGVPVMNINDLANTLKTAAVPGDTLILSVVKPGEGEGQGVGYMPDGTMVVVEDGAQCVGATIQATVTNSLQTSAGKMIFARFERTADGGEAPAVSRMAAAAIHQPRSVGRGPRGPRGEAPPDGRNPRR